MAGSAVLKGRSHAGMLLLIRYKLKYPRFQERGCVSESCISRLPPSNPCILFQQGSGTLCSCIIINVCFPSPQRLLIPWKEMQLQKVYIVKGRPPSWELPLPGISPNSATVIPSDQLGGCILPCWDWPEALAVSKFLWKRASLNFDSEKSQYCLKIYLYKCPLTI